MPDTTTQPTTWYTLTAEAVAEKLKVDPKQGLSSAEVEQRLQQYGPNVMTAEEKEPYWLSFLKQYKDYMRIVLTVAAVASLIIGEYSTAIILLIITAGNAWMALHQESKAEDSVAALGKMMKGMPTCEIPQPADLGVTRSGSAYTTSALEL